MLKCIIPRIMPGTILRNCHRMVYSCADIFPLADRKCDPRASRLRSPGSSCIPPRRRHGKTPTNCAWDSPTTRVRTYHRKMACASLPGWFLTREARGLVYFSRTATRAVGRRCFPYLTFLHAAGYSVLLHDFRAHGWSGGQERDARAERAAGSCKALIRWAESRSLELSTATLCF